VHISISRRIQARRLPESDSVPVELLRDQRGVYGIGVSEEFDFEALALMCGAEQDPRLPSPLPRAPRALILRPDYFERTKPHGAVLQKIVGGFRNGIFCRSAEEQLRQFIHHEALGRAGLPWPPDHREPYWSKDRAQQARNRGIYHGLRALSLCVINRLIGELHEAVADPDAIRAARRFTFRHREEIYRAAALSPRALQLIDVFPVAALAIYADCWPFLPGDSFWLRHAERSDQQQKAKNLVERGARLRDVAAALGIPLALRHLKPGVAHFSSEILVEHPELLHWMPATTSAARIWLLSINFAHRRGGIDYAHWVARHVPEMPGLANQVTDTVTDLLDWVLATKVASGREFVARPFTPAIGVKAAMQASRDWHEAVASMSDATNHLALPPPWYPPAKQAAFEIVPITTAADLYREGREMHHCVGSYADRVREGCTYVYSVRQDGKPVATVSLVRHDGNGALTSGHGGQVAIEQVRGPCNVTPSKAIMSAVRRWLRTQPAPAIQIQPRQQKQLSEWLQRYLATDADDAENIPF
jgi:hypothetical protein